MASDKTAGSSGGGGNRSKGGSQKTRLRVIKINANIYQSLTLEKC